MTVLGAIFLPYEPPERLRAVAVAAEEAGLEQLWLWEDCFRESGIAPAAAALAWTDRLSVGIGLMPVPLRNVALTAMEIATVERMFPGRFVPGIGHGVLDWMGRVGVRAASPMTLLREYTVALRSLLHGETVTTDGRYVHLDAVGLDWPSSPPPPLLVGAIGPKTVTAAAALSDGVIFTGDTTVDALRAGVAQARTAAADAGRPAPRIVVFATVEGRPAAEEVAAQVHRFVDAGATTVALQPAEGALPPEQFVAFVGREVRPLVR